MKFLPLLLPIVFVITSCTSDQPSENGDPAIAQLEQAFKETDSPDAAKAVLDAYEAYIEANPNDVMNNSIYLEKAAKIHLQGKRFETTADILRQALRNYPMAANKMKMLIQLGTLYEKDLNNPVLAGTVWQALNTAKPSQVEIDLRDKLEILPPVSDRMTALLYSMTDSLTGRLKFRVASDYINSAELFAAIAPKSELSPSFLYKAGEIARSIGMFDRSVDLYNWIGNKYSNYDKASKALFMQAFIVEEDLKDDEGARALYEEFLQKYPEDDFAASAQAMLENLGKSDEEILKQFEQ